MKYKSRQAMCPALAWGLFVVLAAALIFRAQWCMNGPDESYYLAKTYAMLMGGRPLADISALTQISNILLLPLMWLYRLVTGGLDGVYLASRVAAVLLQTCAALAVWRWLRQITGEWAALAGGLLCQLFIPLNLTALSYNSMGLFFILLFFACAEPLARRAGFWRAFGAGVCFALAAAAYPPLVVTAPVALVLVWRTERSCRLLALGGLCAGGAVPAIVVLGWLTARLGPAGLLESLPNLFAKDVAHQGSGGLLASARQYLSDFVWWFGLAYLAAVVLVALLAAALRFLPGAARLRPVFWAGFALVAVWGLVMRPGGLFWINFKLVPLALLGPALFLAVRPQKPAVRLLLWTAGVLYSGGIALGTDVGLVNASYGFLLCNLAAMLWLEEEVCRHSGTCLRRWVGASAVLAVLMLAQLAGIRFFTDYAGDLFACRVRIENGPSAGMWDTADTVSYYNQTCQDLREQVQPGEGLFVMNVLPWAYMACDSLPNTPDYWIHSAADPMIQWYYEQPRRQLPQVVYLAGPLPDGRANYNLEQPLAECLEQSWIRDRLLADYSPRPGRMGTFYLRTE